MSDNEMVVGRIVHYKVKGECRAAIVVKVWSQQTVNLTWFGDMSKDYTKLSGSSQFGAPLLITESVTSVIQGEEDGQWHWPRECQNK